MNETREKLLDVAYEEFYRNGYYATSIDKILKKANMNKGSMYHFFKSKKELTLAVIKERLKKYSNERYSVLLEYESNIIEEILKLFKKQDLFDFNIGCKINNFVQELSSKDEDFKNALEDVYLNFEQIIEKALENAKKANEIEYEDTKALSIFIVASVEGCLGTAKKSQNGQVFYDCFSQLEFFLNSIKK